MEIKKEDKKTLYISIAMIALLFLVSFFQMRNLDFSNISLSVPSFEESDIPSLENLFSEEGLSKIIEGTGFFNEEEVNFTLKEIEGRLSFEYPSSWKVLDTSIEEEAENVETLFAASSQKITTPAGVVVLKIKEEEKDKAVEIIKKLLKEDGAEKINISTKEENNDKEYSVQITHEYQEGVTGQIEGKMFFLDDIFYTLLLAFYKEMPLEVPTINRIISSVQIIE